MTMWKDAIVTQSTPIVHVVKVLDSSISHIGLVVDAQGKLLGTITDGDVRTGISASISLNDTVGRIMKYAAQDR